MENNSTETTPKPRISMIIKLGGAYISYMLGAGFASGQEMMQYFTNFGFLWSILGILLTTVIATWSTAVVLKIGYESSDKTGKLIYTKLCGKYLGKVFSYFVPFAAFLLYIVMISGSGAAFNQHFGTQPWIGCAIFAIVSAVIVILGLTRIVNSIGFVGPLIIFICCLLCVIVLIQHPLNVQAYDSFLQSHNDLYRAADSWWVSAILYATFGVGIGLPFLSAMGTQAISKKEILIGVVFGNVLFCLALAGLSFSLASKIGEIFNSSLPALALADNISPLFGTVYAVILLLAIITTAIPLLWSASERVAPEGSKFHIPLIIFIAVVGFFGGQLPFEELVNVLFPFMGYVSNIILACIVWREVKMYLDYRKKKIEL